MKTRALTKFILAALAVCLFALAGCVTTQKINWTARMGHYTYSQAVAEFGPPDKITKLAGGGTAADWMIERGHVQVAPEPGYVAPGGYGPVSPVFNQPYVPNDYMRLTFGADGQLKDYKEFAR